MDNTVSRIDTQLFTLIHQFLLENKSERATRALSPEASLERDLGIGSLEKAELLGRIERAFQIRLPDSTLVNAQTVKDLIFAIQAASGTISSISTVIEPEKISSKTTGISLASAHTLVELLLEYGQKEPHRPHVYLQDETGQEHVIHYGELLSQASQMAQGMLVKGLQPGDTVAIMLPTSADFFYCFFGILLAGGIPVPIYPPFRPDQIAEYAKREAKILQNAEIRLLITFAEARTLSTLLQPFIPSLKAVLTVKDLLKAKGYIALPHLPAANTPVLIQYTSGSTGDPKGVLLTHDNLLSNIRAIDQVIQIKATDVAVSWLPLYHDMGLIGMWLGSFYHGVPLVALSPFSFLMRPERWLWAIHYHRATVSAAPNFAYELCIRKIEASTIAGLDLHSWRVALNGAEAIYPDTIRKFSAKFAPYQFQPETFLPAYGLAESSVGLVLPTPGRKPVFDKIARQSFETEQKAVPVESNKTPILEFVSCGKPLPGHEICIVDETGKTLAEREIGRLLFKGPSSMQGYFRHPHATAAVHHDEWWDSGDLAYQAHGEIFITGRKKDVIIIAGRNLYPQEIEHIVENISGVRRGCVAAFSIEDRTAGTEKLVVVAETNAKEKAELDQIRSKIVEQIVAILGISLQEIVLTPPKTIPKTSSGKLQRSACKSAYLNGCLQRKLAPGWMQISQLVITSWKEKSKRGLLRSAEMLYTFYSRGIVLMAMGLSWLNVVLLPDRYGPKILKFWARLSLRLAFCPVTVTGCEHLPTDRPLIIIANHASYLDAIVLTAVLPPNILFIGKVELTQSPILRTLLKKGGHLTTDRMDFSQSLADIEHIKKSLKAGRSILFFPEGTFTYAAGLRSFKLGAFKIAVDTQIPLCPIGLQGTRHILRGDDFVIKPGSIRIVIGPLIHPQGHDWSEVIRLAQFARQKISEYCGEQMIDLITSGLTSREGL